MRTEPSFLQLASERSVVRRALALALVVGPILIAINHGDRLVEEHGRLIGSVGGEGRTAQDGDAALMVGPTEATGLHPADRSNDDEAGRSLGYLRSRDSSTAAGGTGGPRPRSRGA